MSIDVGSPVRQVSFSSEVSDLPPTTDIDERIEAIRNLLRQRELDRENRRQEFLQRCRQCRKRIDTLQTTRIKRLQKVGIEINLDVIKCTLSKEALVWKKKFEEEEKELEEKNRQEENALQESEDRVEFQQKQQEEEQVSQTVVKESEKNRQFVFSVKDELAKLNLGPQSKKTKKDTKFQKPNVVDIANKRQDAKKQDNIKRRNSLVMAVAEENKNVTPRPDNSSSMSKRDTVRSSLSLEKSLVNRRNSFDALSPLLGRKKSSDAVELPKLTDNVKQEKKKAKGRRKSVSKEPPMWGDILKMGREQEKKDKKKKT